jgi:CheY-like chemotaxis protein
MNRDLHILLVEDNPGDARLTMETFREAKREKHLSHVADGAEALAFLRREGPFSSAPRPDLVLLDLNLPCKDGREVLAEIKSDDRLKRIPVVVFTTSEAEDDVLKVYNLCANCYVSKPIQLDEFVRVIQCIEDFWLSVAKLPAE